MFTGSCAQYILRGYNGERIIWLPDKRFYRYGAQDLTREEELCGTQRGIWPTFTCGRRPITVF